MITISPSLLASDFLNLNDEINKLNEIKDLWIHLDIMDGHFVPNLTFGPPIIKNMHKISNHKLDAHLMVTNPQDYIYSLKEAGIFNFTFHWEAVTHHDRLISELKKHFSSVGISLNPSTPTSAIPKYLFKEIDLILIMSVNPGFGGQKFIDGTLKKIEELRDLRSENNLNFIIQVDGGVTDNNASLLTKAGANNLVAGSFVFGEKNKDYKKQINKLK